MTLHRTVVSVHTDIGADGYGTNCRLWTADGTLRATGPLVEIREDGDEYVVTIDTADGREGLRAAGSDPIAPVDSPLQPF